MTPSPESSTDKRRELAKQVVSLFFAAEREGQGLAQGETFGDIFLNMLGDLELDDKVRLSENMAASEDASLPLIRKMSMDQVEVARPVLEHSPLLTEDDLLEVTQNATAEHRLAVSRRETGLTARVTDSLISFGETPVLRSVIENKAAEISPSGFKSLVDSSETDDELLTRLAQRVDIPPDCAERILPRLNAELRAKLLALAEHDEAALEGLVTKARSEEAGHKLSARQQKVEARALLEAIEKKQRTLDDVARMLAEEGRLHALIAVLAGRSMLPTQKVTSAVFEVNGQLISFICKALDLEFETYFACDALRRQSLHLPKGDRAKLEPSYAALDVEETRRTLRFVSVMLNVG